MSECPLMTPAWVGLMQYTFSQPEARAAFERETGTTAISLPKSRLDSMIDDACGVHESYLKGFTAWATATLWGSPEGVPEDIWLEASRLYPQLAEVAGGMIDSQPTPAKLKELDLSEKVGQHLESQ